MTVGILLTVAALPTAYFLTYKKPLYALMVIIVALPTFLIRWHIGWIGSNTLDLLIFGSFMIYIITHSDEMLIFAKNNKWILYTIATVFFTSLAAVVVSPVKITALGIIKSYFAGPLIILFMTVALIKTKNDLKKILLSFSLLTLITGIGAIIQIWFPETIPNPSWQGPENFRATSFLTYPNAIGLLLAPIIPLLIYLHTVLENRWLILLNTVSILAGLLSIWLAKSKGALLALALTAIIISAYLFRKKLKYVLIAFLLLLILIPPSLSQLITTIGPSSYSAQLRFIQWQDTFDLLRDKPLQGAGLAGFQTIVEKYHTVDFVEIFLYPHNIILNFWVELGVIGMFIFMTLIFYALVKNIKLLKNERAYALTGIAAILIILIHGMVDVPYFKNDLAVVFWFLYSWPFLMYYNEGK